VYLIAEQIIGIYPLYLLYILEATEKVTVRVIQALIRNRMEVQHRPVNKIQLQAVNQHRKAILSE